MLELNNVFDELYAKSPAWPDAVNRISVTEHQSHEAPVVPYTGSHMPQPRPVVGKDVKARPVSLNSQSEYLYARAIVHGLQCGVRYADAFASYQIGRAHV